MKTTVEQPKQKLTGQYSCEFTTDTLINLFKGNVRHFVGEYEKLDNNLSELKTVINVFDVFVRKKSNKQKNQLFQDLGPFDLHLI